MRHPFDPIIFKNTKYLLIGTLPPENAKFYFSNSPNTRLWDLLNSILKDKSIISRNSNELSIDEKCNILKKLSLGITDIILEYDRKKMNSTKDTDIIPKLYNNISEIIKGTEIDTLLFVYKNALKWFFEFISGKDPLPLSKIKSKIIQSPSTSYINDKTIKLVLLPSPLNRGEKGQTLDFKLKFYEKIIKNDL
ncbi:MAG: hypothetical protein JXN64_09615 [Spirochaetes bacterium]|nr:hypothetical protein [Spirochaetota bacterium]